MQVEQLDDSYIQKSTILNILQMQNSSEIDKFLENKIDEQTLLFTKKLMTIIILRKQNILNEKAIDTISDSEFMIDFLHGKINIERLKLLLKLQFDPRVKNDDNELIKHNAISYIKLKELHLKDHPLFVTIPLLPEYNYTDTTSIKFILNYKGDISLLKLPDDYVPNYERDGMIMMNLSTHGYTIESNDYNVNKALKVLSLFYDAGANLNFKHFFGMEENGTPENLICRYMNHSRSLSDTRVIEFLISKVSEPFYYNHIENNPIILSLTIKNYKIDLSLRLFKILMDHYNNDLEILLKTKLDNGDGNTEKYIERKNKVGEFKGLLIPMLNEARERYRNSMNI